MASKDEIHLIIEGDYEEQLKALDRRESLVKEDLEREKKYSANRRKLQEELGDIEYKKSVLATEASIKMLEEAGKKEEAEKERKKLAEKEHQRQQQKEQEELEKKRVEYIKGALISGLDSVRKGISEAAETYASYVDKMQTRLFGANETAGSISDKLTQVFGASPIFKMTAVMENAAKFVESGINFNIESRAAMATLAEKVATTFDAFDSNLARLVKIQQEDSTQARLGMYNMLTQFLNSNFQDSSYLNNLSKTVTANLLEAEARLGREESTALEYSVQKWLGSLSSLGVSDDLIQQLSQGIGYLASGNISALNGNSALESLLVTAATRGGANYGDMLINGVEVDDVTKIMRGLHSLVTEIASNENAVAVSQYAQVFGMSVSNIRSILHLGSDALDAISSDMAGYEELKQRVVDETTFSKLMSRTSGASIGKNLWDNFLYGSGRAMASSPVSYLTWQLSDFIVDTMKGLETGLDVQPFGVGTHLNLSVSDIAKIAVTAVGALPGIASMIGSIGTIARPNLGALEEEGAGNLVVKGDLLSFAQEGSATSQTAYAGDFSEGALSQSSKAVSQQAIAEHKDETYDEEKAKTEKMTESMSDVADNVKIIVKLLNDTGIVIRGSSSYTDPVSLDELLKTDDTGHRLIGVEAV